MSLRSDIVGSQCSPAFDAALLAERLAELRREPIREVEKGFLTGATCAADLVESGRGAFDGTLATPFALLSEPALDMNGAAMAAYCRSAGVELAPHAKTTMCPEIFARQLETGAFGLTAATPHQVAVLRRFGVRRIVLANELVDLGAIAWLARELNAHPEFEFCCYVDSVVGAALVDEALRASGLERRLPVLVELGMENGRSGTRTLEGAMAVAAAVDKSRCLRLVGVAGFEGSVGTRGGTHRTLEAVRRYVRTLRDVGERVRDSGLARGTLGDDEEGSLLLSAGGSGYFDIVAEELAQGGTAPEAVKVVLRSGGYVCHDHGLLARWSPFVRGTARGPVRPALEVWAQVISCPEPGFALLNAGRRDYSTDIDLPVVTSIRRDGETREATGLRVIHCNDQHSYVAVEGDDVLAVGDLVSLGISHCCTTFDKWRLLPVVDEAGRFVEIAHTYF